MFSWLPQTTKIFQHENLSHENFPNYGYEYVYLLCIIILFLQLYICHMAAHQGADVDEAALRTVFPRLVEELRASDIIDELYQRNLLDRNEYVGILDASFKDDSKAVNRRVLMAVGRRPAGFVPALVKVLSKKYSSLAAALEKGERPCMLCACLLREGSQVICSYY